MKIIVAYRKYFIFVFCCLFLFLSFYVSASANAIRLATRIAPYTEQIAVRMAQDVSTLLKHGLTLPQQNVIDTISLDKDLPQFEEELVNALNTNTAFNYSISNSSLTEGIFAYINSLPETSFDKVTKQVFDDVISQVYYFAWESEHRIARFSVPSDYKIVALTYKRINYNTVKPQLIIDDSIDLYTVRDYWNNPTNIYLKNTDSTFFDSATLTCVNSIQSCTNYSWFADKFTINNTGEFPADNITLQYLNTINPAISSSSVDIKDWSVKFRVLPKTYTDKLILLYKQNYFGLTYNNYLQAYSIGAQSLPLTNMGNDVWKLPNGATYDGEIDFKLPNSLAQSTVDINSGVITVPLVTPTNSIITDSPAWYDLFGWLSKIWDAIKDLSLAITNAIAIGIDSILDSVQALYNITVLAFEQLFIHVQSITTSITSSFSNLLSTLFVPTKPFSDYITLKSLNLTFLNLEIVEMSRDECPLNPISGYLFDFFGLQPNYFIINTFNMVSSDICDRIKSDLRPFINTLLLILYFFYVINQVHKVIRNSDVVSKGDNKS